MAWTWLLTVVTETDSSRAISRVDSRVGSSRSVLALVLGAGGQVGVVLGYPDLASYTRAGGRVGATMGRFVNRIRGASFTLDGQTLTMQVRPESGDTLTTSTAKIGDSAQFHHDLDALIDVCVTHMPEIDPAEARAYLEALLPTLNYWRERAK